MMVQVTLFAAPQVSAYAAVVGNKYERLTRLMKFQLTINRRI
jgi:hypothetical protein